MTDGPRPTVDTPSQLLATAHELARRVHRAQRGAWFPLLLLGLVVLAATPVYRFGSRGHLSCSPVTVASGPGPGGAAGLSRACFIASGWPALVYWLVALVLAYAVIAGFYVHRARRRGVGTRIRPYIIAGIAALLAAVAFWPVQQHLGRVQPGYQLGLAVHGLNPLLAVGLALFVLAWVERDRALLVFAAGYLAAALLASFSDVPRRLLVEHGWAVTTGTFFLPGLWLAGGVLLLGGAGFAMAERLRK